MYVCVYVQYAIYVLKDIHACTYNGVNSIMVKFWVSLVYGPDETGPSNEVPTIMYGREDTAWAPRLSAGSTKFTSASEGLRALMSSTVAAFRENGELGGMPAGSR